MTAHWGIPIRSVDGTADVIVRAFRYAFVVLNHRIGLFLSLPLSTLDQLAIKRESRTLAVRSGTDEAGK
jgi:arsenate reductase